MTMPTTVLSLSWNWNCCGRLDAAASDSAPEMNEKEV